MKDLSIIIVNWNSADYVIACIRSIYAQRRDLDFEIIVVDNASHDRDDEILRNVFPEICIIRADRNRGFAAANNLGFQYSSGEYILFLNPDTEVLGSAIETMVAVLKRSADCGAVSCQLLNSDGSVQTSCIQPFPTIMNQFFDLEFLQAGWHGTKLWHNRAFATDVSGTVEVDAVSGACVMLGRETFEKVGKFDENYFMYAEDVDLCYKVRKLGGRIRITDLAAVVHHGGGSSKLKRGNEWVAIMQRKAILRFCRNTRGQLYAELYRLSMALSAVIRLGVMGVVFTCGSRQRRLEIAQFSSVKWLGILKWAVGLDRLVAPVTDGS